MRDSPRLFDIFLSETLNNQGLVRAAPGFFISDGVVLTYYVDDIIIARRPNSPLLSLAGSIISRLESVLTVRFATLTTTTFLGSEIVNTESAVRVDIKDYIKKTETPIESDALLKAKGRLGWLAQSIPPLAYHFSTLASTGTLQQVREAIDSAARAVPLTYVKVEAPVLNIWSDAAFKIADHTAQHGWIVCASETTENPLIWRSFKAKRLVRSVAQAELLSALDAVQSNCMRVAVFHALFPAAPVYLNIDNSAVIHQLQGTANPDPLIAPTLELLKQLCDDFQIVPRKVATQDMLGDCLTKPMSSNPFMSPLSRSRPAALRAESSNGPTFDLSWI